MYPFKDFSTDNPFHLLLDGGAQYGGNGVPIIAKQTWTNPFTQMSFDMFTIPTESPDHRNSSLSQEQQSEMMVELERGLEQGELPDLDAKRMSMVGERETIYNEAVLWSRVRDDFSVFEVF